jgi:hypothetical protein
VRPTRRLARLERSATKRLRRIQLLIQSATGPLVAHRVSELTVSYATVEALNAWANFVRAYYASCMLGAARSTGPHVAVEAMFRGCTPPQAIDLAVAIVQPWLSGKGPPWRRSQEPAWHDVRTMRLLAQTAEFSNSSDIDAAVSTGSRVFSDLPVFRNYYSHRNAASFRAAMALASINGVGRRESPTRLLLSVPLAGTEPLLVQWLDDLQFTIEYMCA